jgi:hypothetical protein
MHNLPTSDLKKTKRLNNIGRIKEQNKNLIYKNFIYGSIFNIYSLDISS